MKQYDIGLDLGTTSIIIATQEQGVVFHQPSIGAIDTRSSTILAVGDKALRMVGRVPSYIDIIRPFAHHQAARIGLRSGSHYRH